MGTSIIVHCYYTTLPYHILLSIARYAGVIPTCCWSLWFDLCTYMYDGTPSHPSSTPVWHGWSPITTLVWEGGPLPVNCFVILRSFAIISLCKSRQYSLVVLGYPLHRPCSFYKQTICDTKRTSLKVFIDFVQTKKGLKSESLCKLNMHTRHPRPPKR